MFKLFRAILTLAAVIQVFAAPTNETADDNLIIVHSQPHGNGMLTLYGNAPGTVTVGSQSPAPLCGSNDVTCSGSNTANSSICINLINEIRFSGTVLPSDPRSLCLSEGGAQCCISWSKDIGSVVEAYLYNAAADIYSSCTTSTVSGYATSVSINGQCLTQCLSNRPTGCTT